MDDPERIHAKAELIQAALAFDDEQALRARQFQAQVDKAFGRKVHQLTPITQAELRRHLSPYLYSTSLPGRIMPALLFGPDYANHPAYIPIERRLVRV